MRRGAKTSKKRKPVSRKSRKLVSAKQSAKKTATAPQRRTKATAKKRAKRPTKAKQTDWLAWFRRDTPKKARKRKLTREIPQWLFVSGQILHRVAFLGFLLFVGGVFSLFYFARDLPSISGLEDRPREHQVTILDRDGALITNLGNVYGDPVAVSELPQHVAQAFIATEDRNFYHHLGVNPFSIIRALFINLQTGSFKQGGSTITQQLAKNVFLSPEKTIKRKVQEMLLSFQLEMAYSKDEILSLYLNNVYFGSGAYGLRAASNRYFDKQPEELLLGEAAMLAGLLKAPSRYSPFNSVSAAQDRAKLVLSAMFEAGYISREKLDTLATGPIARVVYKDNPAPYATDFVVSELDEVCGTLSQDVVVNTTLDLQAHRLTKAAIRTLPTRDTRFTDDIQIALIAMEADGAIKLLIGGRDYTESQYNRAMLAMRQPGSAFKPFVYLAALENGWTPDDIIFDTPIELGNWKPENYKNKYYGAVELREAMARSLNAAAIRLQEETGRENVIAVARRLGFSDELEPGAALALGVNETTPLKLATSYLPFANKGFSAEPYMITSVANKRGEVVCMHENYVPARVVKQENLVAANHMLRDVVRSGSGRAASLPGYTSTAGKTGTSQESRDAWFAGHAAGVVGVVWLGKDDNSPMDDGWSPVSGAGAPAILWRDMMQAVLNGRPDVEYEEWYPEPEAPFFMERLRRMFSSPTQISYEANVDTDIATMWETDDNNPMIREADTPQTMESLLQNVLYIDENQTAELPKP